MQDLPYLVQMIVWIVILAVAGNVVGLAIRLMTRRR